VANVDLDAARELGIVVRNTPDAPRRRSPNSRSAALIALLRRIPHMDRQLHEGGGIGPWDAR